MENTNYYDALSLLLDNQISPSEAHGMLTGFISAKQNDGYPIWTKELSDIVGKELLDDKILSDFYRDNQQALVKMDFSFELLLPAHETVSPAERTQAIKEWCQGFLYALGLCEVKLEEDALEFTTDLIEFTRMDFDDSGGEGEQQALEEIIEFVRMGILLVYHHLAEAQ